MAKKSGAVKALVAYYRVSTKKQGSSGLGLEAQKALVELRATTLGLPIVAVFTEIETGKRSDRPELSRALTYARAAKARLVIAKLDRLARNVHFISGLIAAGVEFEAADMPYADKFMLHIYASVAEQEADMIAARTRAALDAYKARGGVLGAHRAGAHRFSVDDGQLGGKVLRDRARHEYADIPFDLRQRRDAGASLRELAAYLNSTGRLTRTGKPWSTTQVWRVLRYA